MLTLRAQLLVFALMTWLLVKVFASPSSGTTDGFTLSVPDPVIGPPVRPVPLATLVTVPPLLLSVAQAQEPLHLRIWPLAQLARPRLVLPPGRGGQCIMREQPCEEEYFTL